MQFNIAVTSVFSRVAAVHVCLLLQIPLKRLLADMLLMVGSDLIRQPGVRLAARVLFQGKVALQEEV